MMKNNLLEIAQVGKVVGLQGYLKLHDRSDFPEQYKKGASFTTHKGNTLKVLAYNVKKGEILFEGHETRESALALVNTTLFTTKEATKDSCELKSDEYFWFDIEGCEVFENELKLGKVKECERIGDVDYLHVESDSSLKEKNLSNSFLIPYIDRFVKKVDIEAKRIDVIDGLALLESS